MVRALLILASVLLLLGVTRVAVDVAGVDLHAGELAEGDCCPDEVPGEGDCCDWDLGACCSSAMLGVLPSTSRFPQVALPVRATPQRSVLPGHLLLPRLTGPPPTPPPIA